MRFAPSDHNNNWHPLSHEAFLALWITTVGNLPLWRAVLSTPDTQQPGGLHVIGALGTILTSAMVIVLWLFMWGPWRRVLGVLLLILSATASYFMAAYGVVVDPTMVANVFHTDLLEAQGLMSWSLVFALLFGAFLPSIWWWRAPIRPVAPWRHLWQRCIAVLIGSIVLATALFLGFQGISALMRNHKSIRYMINPFNSVYGIVVQGFGETAKAVQPLRPVGLDAKSEIGTFNGSGSPLVVLVVGETVRAANFGLNGYGRQTTPRLEALRDEGDLIYFSSVESCGTSTQVSVPCMFSRLGRSGLAKQPEESLMDLVQRAGLGVYWLDNQAGCKGVCDRVPNAFVSSLVPPEACRGSECPDATFLQALPKAAAAIDSIRDARGSLLVMHQMGNHGPSYFLRSDPARKTFLPECETNALASCDPQTIVNAYDNAIKETDELLASTVTWLKRQERPVALFYVSDHGESLGEKGIYLHGMPWSLAPDVQKRVPMLLWTSPGMRKFLDVQMSCLKSLGAKPWSHDNVFHTISGLLRLSSSDINPAKDILASCRN